MKATRVDIVAAALIGVLSLWALTAVSGRVTRSGGAGYDGEIYVEMVQNGWHRDGGGLQLRPFFIFVAEFVNYYTFRDPVATFKALNYVYAAVLAAALALLIRSAGGDRASTLMFVTNVSLTIAGAKMFAYNPVLIDLGAYAAITLAVYGIHEGRRSWAIAGCTVSTLSREFGVVTALYGVVRDWRQGQPLWKTASTYALPVAAYVALHQFVVLTITLDGRQVGSLELVRRYATVWLYWEHWLFAAYFLCTVFGGVTLVLVAHARETMRALAREYELAALIVPLLALALLGIDLWRYFAYLLPAVALLYASLGRSGRLVPPVLATMSVATLVTQRPWQHMTEMTYFRDWFPSYELYEHPAADHSGLWEVWIARLVAAAALLLVMIALDRVARRVPAALRSQPPAVRSLS